MGQDTIRAIRNAEQKAEQMEKEAASACAAMIAEAKNRAKAEGDAMLLAVKEENARLIAAAKEAAAQKLSLAQQTAQSDIEKMIAMADAKKEQAIEMILSELF